MVEQRQSAWEWILCRMKPFLFQQWVACAVMAALVCNLAAPLAFCKCEGCPCEDTITRFLPTIATTCVKCCCTPPETETSCRQCGYVQVGEALPPAVLPVNETDFSRVWDMVSESLDKTLPHVGFDDALGLSSRLDKLRTLSPLHVPLHVLLCVFLN